jgi:hypothetical protein
MLNFLTVYRLPHDTNDHCECSPSTGDAVDEHLKKQKGRWTVTWVGSIAQLGDVTDGVEWLLLMKKMIPMTTNHIRVHVFYNLDDI